MNTFPKSEKLCGEIQINRLFTEGKAFIVYPIRIVYMLVDKQDVAVQLMTSVPKKKIRKATDRNRIKRLIREAYRLNKSDFYGFFKEKGLTLHVAFTYVSDQKTDFETLSVKVPEALRKILKKYEGYETN